MLSPEFMDIHERMVGPPGDLPFNKAGSLFPSSHLWTITPQLGMGLLASLPSPYWDLIWLLLVQFTCSCPVVSRKLLAHSCPLPLTLTIFLPPLPSMISQPWGVAPVMSHLELSILQSHYPHLNQLSEFFFMSPFNKSQGKDVWEEIER